jgi:hypothetical protein
VIAGEQIRQSNRGVPRVPRGSLRGHHECSLQHSVRGSVHRGLRVSGGQQQRHGPAVSSRALQWPWGQRVHGVSIGVRQQLGSVHMYQGPGSITVPFSNSDLSDTIQLTVILPIVVPVCIAQSRCGVEGA